MCIMYCGILFFLFMYVKITDYEESHFADTLQQKNFKNVCNALKKYIIPFSKDEDNLKIDSQ